MSKKSIEEMLDEVVGIQAQIIDLSNRYREKTKEYFGVTDGQTLNIAQIVSLIQKVIREQKA